MSFFMKKVYIMFYTLHTLKIIQPFLFVLSSKERNNRSFFCVLIIRFTRGDEMKNALFYYYDIYPEKLLYTNHEYHFSINTITYRLIPFKRPLEEVKSINELSHLLTTTLFSTILKNKFQESITPIEHKNYILLQEKVPSKKITIEDIAKDYHPLLPLNNFPLLNRSDWVLLWSEKIDYFEYQKNYIKTTYPHLFGSLDYYIGLAETAISYITEVKKENQHQEKLTIARKRVYANMDIRDFYSPLNIVIDYPMRDLAEYLKSLFLLDEDQDEKIKNILHSLQYDTFDYSLLMGRVLFPSFYFDTYEQIINGTLQEEKIIPILEKSEDYETFLYNIYQTIRSYIPKIDWLEIYRYPN